MIHYKEIEIGPYIVEIEYDDACNSIEVNLLDEGGEVIASISVSDDTDPDDLSDDVHSN